VNNVTADELINKAVKIAIREYSKEQKADKRAKALHNTKMLLKNYNKIKSSIEEAISEESQLNESLKYDEDDGVYINSIRKSKLKSLIIISHIDRALELTKDEYERRDMLYKYISLYDCLINGVTFEVEAEALNTSTVTVRRWITEITKVLSIRIFGCDGVDIV
jgi:hypothetical protein